MTRDEINALPPDQLTALLAEWVMGWTRVVFGGAGYVWEDSLGIKHASCRFDIPHHDNAASAECRP